MCKLRRNGVCTFCLYMKLSNKEISLILEIIKNSSIPGGLALDVAGIQHKLMKVLEEMQKQHAESQDTTSISEGEASASSVDGSKDGKKKN